MYRPQLTALLLAATIPAAAQHTLRGRVLEGESPVGYATTVLLRDGRQAAGTTTDDAGGFVLTADTGRYTLVLRHVAYRPFEQEVCVAAADTDLGDLPLAPLGISEVTVTAETVTRQADRFVVSIGNTPALAGQDGTELLARAPGVWLGDNGISINGAGGTKVYVDGRELKGSAEETTTYLRSLTAADIARIEVMPLAGTEFAADTRGGAILITLRRRRDGGMDGNLQFSTVQSNRIAGYTPSGRIGIRTGRWTLTASGSGSFTPVAESRFTETREQAGQPLPFAGRSDSKSRTNYGRGHFSAVFDPTPKHTAGFDIEYTERSTHMPTLSRTTLGQTQSDSRYRQHMDGNTLTATANYIWKIDTLGSTLKLLADYTRRETDTRNDNESRITAPGNVLDSVYRDNATSLYDIAAATLALEKHFSPRWSLKAGAKYTRNDMRNDALYEYRRGDVWLRNERQSFTINYTENIAAAYAIASAKLGAVSFVAGVRGEYTHTTGKGVGQDYFSLFPNASLSWSVSEQKGWSLIAQYARTIERPRFWSLSPQRMQLSDYTYQTGNPSLDPSFKHDVSLTLVAAHKYTLTAGVQIVNDEIQQTMKADSENPDLLQVAWVNYDATKGYYLSVNLPFQPAKWWQLNADITYMRRGQRVDQHGAEEFFDWGFVNLSTTLTLPAKFYIDLSYRYQSRIDLGNCWVNPDHRLQAGVKKRFGDRFTASFSVQNLLDQGQEIGARGDGFVRTVDARQTWSNRTYRIGVTWNFKSGKAFKRKAVEAGSADEKSRL